MKRLLFTFAFMLAFLAGYSQLIIGGGGVCHVNDDPDNITSLQTQDAQYECLVAWDNVNQALYVYDATQSSGNRWTEVPLSAVTDTDTRLDNPRVTGGNLVFDLYDEVSDTDIGDISIPVIDIAPIQNVLQGTGITVSINGAGEATITNSAPDQTVVLNNGTGIVVSGTYPNFTITNDSPDQVVSLTGGDGTTVTGTYPNFTIDDDDHTDTEAANHADAGVQGVNLNEWFIASGTNTMGSSPGTKIQRKY